MVDYMRSKLYIFAGWAVALTAIGAASIAFPAIADKAADQREAAQWQARAQAFSGVELSDVETSSHAERLTEFHTDKAIENALMRDRIMTDDLLPVSAQEFDKAKFEAQEHRCLAEAVYYEARSEPRSGQQAVAEVVQNRVTSKHYPNSICAVVYEGAERNTGCQFSFTCDGSTLRAPYGRYWDQSQAIATMAVTGGFLPITDRATHYHTVFVDPKWSSNLRYNKQIGLHKFYRFKFRERPVQATGLRVAPPI